MEEYLKNSITKYNDVIHERLFWARGGEYFYRSWDIIKIWWLTSDIPSSIWRFRWRYPRHRHAGVGLHRWKSLVRCSCFCFWMCQTLILSMFGNPWCEHLQVSIIVLLIKLSWYSASTSHFSTILHVPNNRGISNSTPMIGDGGLAIKFGDTLFSDKSISPWTREPRVQVMFNPLKMKRHWGSPLEISTEVPN